MTTCVQLIPEDASYDDLKAAVLRLYDDIYVFHYDRQRGDFRLGRNEVVPMEVGTLATVMSFEEACLHRERGMEHNTAVKRLLAGRMYRRRR